MKTLTHAELLTLLGEIDGISLESVHRCDTNLQDIVVYVELRGKRVELIRELRDGGVISHGVTRWGIADALEAGKVGDVTLKTPSKQRQHCERNPCLPNHHQFATARHGGHLVCIYGCGAVATISDFDEK